MSETFDPTPIIEAAKMAKSIADVIEWHEDHDDVLFDIGRKLARKASDALDQLNLLAHPDAILAWAAAHAADLARLAEVEREKRELAEWVLRYSAAKQHLNHPTQAETMRAMMDDAERFMVDIARAALGDRRDG